VYQIAVLAGLFGYGVVWLDFAISGVQTLVILVAALLTQTLCSRLWQLAAYDPRSALVSGLSLGLLLRTHALSLTTAKKCPAMAPLQTHSHGGGSCGRINQAYRLMGA
jgi:hypothetical protein